MGALSGKSMKEWRRCQERNLAKAKKEYERELEVSAFWHRESAKGSPIRVKRIRWKPTLTDRDRIDAILGLKAFGAEIGDLIIGKYDVLSAYQYRGPTWEIIWP